MTDHAPPEPPVDLNQHRHNRTRDRRHALLDGMEDADLDDPTKLLAWMATHQTDALYQLGDTLQRIEETLRLDPLHRRASTRVERIAADPELAALIDFHSAVVEAYLQTTDPDTNVSHHPQVFAKAVQLAIHAHQRTMNRLKQQ